MTGGASALHYDADTFYGTLTSFGALVSQKVTHWFPHVEVRYWLSGVNLYPLIKPGSKYDEYRKIIISEASRLLYYIESLEPQPYIAQQPGQLLLTLFLHSLLHPERCPKIHTSTRLQLSPKFLQTSLFVVKFGEKTHNVTEHKGHQLSCCCFLLLFVQDTKLCSQLFEQGCTWSGL